MSVKELYEIIGGDYNDVLSRLPNDAFIIRFLKKYSATDEFNKMIEAYESKNYPALFEVSHTLKGMSANMSLTRIYKNVSEICESVRNGNPIIDLEPLINQAKEDQALLLDLVSKL